MSMMHSCVFMCASMFMLACFNMYVECLCVWVFIYSCESLLIFACLCTTCVLFVCLYFHVCVYCAPLCGVTCFYPCRLGQGMIKERGGTAIYDKNV